MNDRFIIRIVFKDGNYIQFDAQSNTRQGALTEVSSLAWVQQPKYVQRVQLFSSESETPIADHETWATP